MPLTVGVAGVGNTETFTNIPTSSTSYSDRSWTGDDGSTWTATLARTDQTFNGKAICLKKDATAYVQSGTLNGGCGSISFKTKRGFTTVEAGTITLYINNIQAGVPFAYDETERIASFSNINVVGNFVIKLLNSGGARPIIDDVTWTGYSNVNVLPVISNISNSPLAPTTIDDVVISANISDSDGTIKEAFVKWGLSESNLNNTLLMSLDGIVYKTTIPKQAAGTIYLSVNAKDNVDAVSSVSYNYSVVQNEIPIISNITNNPLNPVTGQAIKIAATISDSDGSIEDSWLRWGTSSSNLSNQVTMALVGGNYETTIPSQTQAGPIYLSINARDDFGAVSTSLYNFSIAQANLFPQITNIVKTPQNPLTGQSVKISASIIDSDGSVQEAFLKWGTSNSSLVNQVLMSLVGGSYEATIPAQTQAGTIYFSINAKDNLDALSTELSSYTVTQNQSPIISNIAKTPQSPLTGQPVKVTATITDSDGLVQEAFLKWGTSNSSLVNQVSMNFISGTYEAIIPAQTQAGTIYFSINAKDNLDVLSTELSSYSVAQNQSPIISNISNSPQSPLTGQVITISATVTDSDGTVQEVWFDWGDATNNLVNKVNMTLAGGSYVGTIPAQSQARTIYLSISAKDNLLSTASVQSSFAISPSTNVNNEENKTRIKVYPNPAKNIINVEVQEVMVSQIVVSNIIGETLISLPYSGSKQTIDISGLKAGIYFIVAIGDGFRKTTRIVIY